MKKSPTNQKPTLRIITSDDRLLFFLPDQPAPRIHPFLPDKSFLQTIHDTLSSDYEYSYLNDVDITFHWGADYKWSLYAAHACFDHGRISESEFLSMIKSNKEEE